MSSKHLCSAGAACCMTAQERCDVLLQWLRKLIVQSMSNGVIPVPPPILTRVFQELSRGPPLGRAGGGSASKVSAGLSDVPGGQSGGQRAVGGRAVGRWGG